MASTRNKNTDGNYKLEQRSFAHARTYESFENSQYGQAYSPALPALGFNPSHMSRNNLSENPIDIESALFGINSTNLVKKSEIIHPKLINVPVIKYFEVQDVIMPKPLVMEHKQRPFPIA